MYYFLFAFLALFSRGFRVGKTLLHTQQKTQRKILISGDTLQVKNYDKYQWTMFDPKAKQERHDTIFPQEMQKAFALGAELAGE